METPRLASSMNSARSPHSPFRSSRRAEDLISVNEHEEMSVADKIMRFLVPMQLILMQLQYIGLLNQLDIGWPENLRSGYSRIEVLNINVREVVGYVEIPVIDFRGMFTIVSVLAPIAITLATLLIFEFVLNIVLYFMLTFGVVVLISGILARFLNSSAIEQASLGSEQANIIVGATLLGVGLIGMLIYKLANIQRGRMEEEHQKLMEFHRPRTLQHCVSTICLVFVGLVLTSVIDFGAGDLLEATSVNIWLYVGIFFLVLGGINLLYLLAILTECGRFYERKMTLFFTSNGLLLIFQLIGMTFIPVLSNAIQLQMCVDYSCPTTKKFNPFAYRPSGSYDTSQSRYCDSCNFMNAKCSSANVSALCPSFEDNRLWTFPETSCVDQSAAFFRVAGFIAIFAYGLFIPLIYWKVSHYLSNAIVTKTDYPNKNLEDPATQWRRIIKYVQPVAGTLYSPFSRGSWFFNLVNLLQRVLVMIALLVIAPHSNVAAAIMFAIFAGYALIVYRRGPYLRIVDQGLANGLAIANVFNGAAALYVWQQGYGDNPDDLLSAFVAANIGFPVIFLFLAWKRRPSPLTKIARSRDMRREHAKLAKDLDGKTGKKYLVHFFMIMGVFFIIAFGACIMGMLQQEKEAYRISTEALYQTNERVLAGYSSWDEMTSRCCCLKTSNPTASFAEGERWLCTNGVTIERGRRNFDGDNAIPLRGICQEKPTDSRCSILTDSNGVPYMSCPDAVKAQYVPSQVSEVAYKYYF